MGLNGLAGTTLKAGGQLGDWSSSWRTTKYKEYNGPKWEEYGAMEQDALRTWRKRKRHAARIGNC